MRVVINEAHINRNRKIAHVLFFVSLAGMGIGFFYSWNMPANSQGGQLSCLILPLLLLMVIASVRMANLWVREPRPVPVLDDALKGLGRKYSIYHHLLPAPHVLVGPEGVYTIFTVWQERTYVVKGSKWFGDQGMLRLINGYLRQDLIGNPFGEATYQAQQLQRLINKVAPDSEITVQPLVVLINPKASFESEEPLLPVLYADRNKKPSLRAYLRDQMSAPHPTLSDEHLDKIDALYGLVTREELAEMAGGEFEAEAEPEEDTGGDPRAEAPSPVDETRRGTVYVLQSGHLYYIGATTGPLDEAVDSVSSAAGRPVDVIHSFQARDAVSMRDSLHRRFERKRQKEQWFGLSQKDVGWLQSRSDQSS